MKYITTFAGQNWLITPAALAVNQTPPNTLAKQTWLLVLSGVAMVDLKGNSGAQWLHETLVITPAFQDPLNWAINQFSVPKPPGTDYWVGFQLEEWAPFAAPSSMFNKDHSVNSGFAVDVWRPHPFAEGNDAVSGAPLTKLFNGIQVDVAVRDTDAYLHRVSYNFTLLGKIVFGKHVIL